MDERAVSLPIEQDRLRDSLLDWYAEQGRSFPWRETTDPFAILVLEVMSQQTQLQRVEPAWEAFLDRWPTPASLAEASVGDVIAFWSDHRLGYNRRAEWLHRAATHIHDQWEGAIPSDPDRLQELDGVGPYTAHAVASFAFNAEEAVVDTNVKRVLYRLSEGAAEAKSIPYDQMARALVPAGRARDWNNAMMDLGATVCTSTPRCEDAPCPWIDVCDAYRRGDFRAPDVPTQPAFSGSRRQYRGRIIRALADHERLGVDELGRTILDEYDPAGERGRDWVLELLEDLAGDGLVRIDDDSSERTIVTLPEGNQA